MKLGIDIDDTLGDLHAVVRPLIKEMLNIEYEKSDISAYCIEEALGVTAAAKVFERYHTHDCSFIEPLEDVVEIMHQLANDYELNIITARCSSSIDLTHDWLCKHKIPFNSLIFDKNKWDVCRHMDIPLMIEDKGETAVKLAEHGITCILLNYSWNQKFQHELIHRVNNWKEVHQAIKQLLPLQTI